VRGFKNKDEFYIAECFKLALKAKGQVSPNPLVGCIIVKDDKIISTGFHKKSGDAHAELDAINNATVSIEGATLYCNLEPCCHSNKKTPPCAQRLIKEKVARVVICNVDPNPDVAGSGLQLLKEAGIEVYSGVLKDIGEELNEIFFHHILHKTPFIHLKAAQTLDGKTATLSGDSKWITNECSREHVHNQRDFYDGILIGANTARLDNPSLTVRLKSKTRCLKRFVLSRDGNLPKTLKIFNDEFKDQTYLVLPDGVKTDIQTNIISVKCSVEENSKGYINLLSLIQELYTKYMITSLYVEGGSHVHTSFLKQGLYNRLSLYTAPKIVGSGRDTFGDLEIRQMERALTLNNIKRIQLQEDLLTTGTKD
jgi:diaminohydroxyphosphoribosylaminopyrimidine deaminase/5-amino-6-(5-phosphoribosylamino)uracil reductase